MQACTIPIAYKWYSYKNFDCGAQGRACVPIDDPNDPTVLWHGQAACKEIVDTCNGMKTDARQDWEATKENGRVNMLLLESNLAQMGYDAMGFVQNMHDKGMFIPDYSETIVSMMPNYSTMTNWSKYGLDKFELGDVVDIYACALGYDSFVGECIECWLDDSDARTFKDMNGVLPRNSESVETCKTNCEGYEFYGLQFPHGFPSPGSVECWCGWQHEINKYHADRQYRATDCDVQFGKFKGMVVGATNTGTMEITGRVTLDTLGTHHACVEDKPSPSEKLDEDDDTTERLFKTRGQDFTDASTCFAECLIAVGENGWVGLQFGNECWCGAEDTDPLKYGVSTDCEKEGMGGYWAMDVYKFLD